MILVVSHRDTYRINKKKIFDTVLYFFLSLKRYYYIKRKYMEMKDFNFEKRPLGYLNCLSDSCPLAEKCLRRISARYSEENDEIFRVVNHRLLDENNCKYYVEDKKVDVAYGMTKSFEEVKAKDIVQIRKSLQNYFGYAEYYRRRNASKPITPKEQEVVKKIFADFGYDIAFDKIVKETLW